jgi:fermentation-respiration switch protein FrsA (DUF1100 family)
VDSTIKSLVIGELSWKRIIRSLLLIPIAVYVGLFMLAWLFPDKVIFQPQPSFYKDDASITKLRTSDGETISAKFYENDDAEFTILFSHGNAEDIGSIEPFVLELQESGFSVLTYDYRGYGTSEGSPSEGNTYRDIDAGYGYLVETRKVPPEKIIFHGRSLGGGVAVDLASREVVGGLILESSFTSASRVLTNIKIIPFDRYENIDKIRAVKCPVLVIHGRQDWTIPFHHREKLLAAANEPKSYLWIDDAGHNDLFSKAKVRYIEAIRGFANGVNR